MAHQINRKKSICINPMCLNVFFQSSHLTRSSAEQKLPPTGKSICNFFINGSHIALDIFASSEGITLLSSICGLMHHVHLRVKDCAYSCCPPIINLSKRAVKTPPDEDTARMQSLFFTPKQFDGSSFCTDLAFPIWQLCLHNPQSTHFTVLITGYKNPCRSGSI